MNFGETICIAVSALKRHRLRSVLTTLGVVIGVASVITMVAVTGGAQRMVAEQIVSMGANRIMLSPHQRGTKGPVDLSLIHTLTIADARSILDECPSVACLTPFARSGGLVVYGNENWQTLVSGAGAEFPRVRNWATARGRFFTEEDVTHANKVCVLGQTVVTHLFGKEVDPVGKVIRLNKLPFLVIGVLEPKGHAVFGQDQDDTVVPPYTTVMKKLTGATHLNQIQVQTLSEEAIDAAQEELTTLLRRRHGIRDGEEADFTVRSQKDLQQVVDETYNTIVTFLLCVASIALLVGGIGIMNIMLVSVTERIREIGIRMAVGARPRDILAQFLAESVILALLGGVVGICCGIASAQGLGMTLAWPIYVDPVSSLLAVVFSGAVGALFGFWPAWRACRMDPIHALGK